MCRQLVSNQLSKYGGVQTSRLIMKFYSLDAGFFQYHQGVKQFAVRSGYKLFEKVISRQQKSPLACKQLNTKLELVDTTF